MGLVRNSGVAAGKKGEDLTVYTNVTYDVIILIIPVSHRIPSCYSCQYSFHCVSAVIYLLSLHCSMPHISHLLRQREGTNLSSLYTKELIMNDV